MNLTLAVDEKIVRKARKTAESMGMSLNQSVRRFLDSTACRDAADRAIAELKELSERSGGRSRGRRLDREEIHERT